MDKQKTVYVLGAGFSAGAKFPLQSQLLADLKSGMFSDSLPAEDHSRLKDNQDKINDFCQAVFPISEEDQPLEDVFTLLDQVILSRGHFSKFSTADLVTVRDAFIYCILHFLYYHSDRYTKAEDTLYDRFAANILQQRMSLGQSADPVSIISLNWDSLLEDAFFRVLRHANGIGKADIDYCVYTTPLPESPHCPSTKQKAAGLFNIKLLKLHGSITWLRCPNSNHIYTGLGALHDACDVYLKRRNSPFIADLFPDSREGAYPPVLEPYIITPTYAKVFDLPHIQTTWHNAYVELREASRIVFIGYSLPESDYHFRTLLRRAIRTGTGIEVVLHTNDRPDEAVGDIVRSGAMPQTAVTRYCKLFGRERIVTSTRYDGIQAYVEDLLPESQYEGIVDDIKEAFEKHIVYNPSMLSW